MSTESLHLAPVPIRPRGYRKHFSGQRMLESMDLNVAADETVVLLGPSGYGKTTTLRIVAGLEAPDAGGTVHFGDEDITARPTERHRVGVVFQSCTLFPNLSVRSNVEYSLRIQRWQNGLSNTQISARANTLLEMMHLTSYADRGVARFSSGRRQRVALVRALAPEPRVLLLDEPFTTLDARLRESVRTEMDRPLRGLGVTAIYVTHDQEEAIALVNHIIVMEAGYVAQIGTPRETYFQPTDRHVTDFIGVMNRLDDARENGAFACAGGRIPVPTGDGDAIFFRPEDAVLADSAQAALESTVESALFLDSRTRMHVTGVSATPLFIDVPGRQQSTLGRVVGFDIPIDHLLTLQA